jgi:hypothetical protein
MAYIAYIGARVSKMASCCFRVTRRLNLQVHCGTRNPVRQMLGVWPVLPIAIWDWSQQEPQTILVSLRHSRITIAYVESNYGVFEFTIGKCFGRDAGCSPELSSLRSCSFLACKIKSFREGESIGLGILLNPRPQRRR